MLMMTELVGFAAGGAGSYIKSIQPFSIAMGTTATTGTATITAVDTNYATIIWGGQTTADNAAAGASPNEVYCHVVLTNSTTITATRNTNTANLPPTIVGHIVEWSPSAVKSVQRGLITLTATTTNTATISSVTTTNSVVLYNGQLTTYSASAMSNVNVMLNLTNATTVTATRGAATLNCTVAYEVLEFQPGVLNSATQEKTTTLTAVTSNTATLSPAVATSNSVLFYGGQSGSFSNNDHSKKAYVQLTNGTTVTTTRVSATDNVSTVVTAVEFPSGVLKSVQRGTGVIASGSTTKVDTITSVDTTKSLINWQGYSMAGAITRNDFGMPDVVLTSATQVTSARNTSTTTALTTGYEVVEFA